MSRIRDIANLLTAANVLSTDVETAAAVTTHSSATDPHGDRAAATAAFAPISTAVTLTGTQTLTSKTLTNPVIASVVNNTLTSTTGDIIYASAANTPARLGVGATGQTLQVANGIPSWATASSGALTKISTQTFSGVSSVTFDTVFTSTYKVYFVTMNKLIMSTSGVSSWQFRKAGVTAITGYFGSQIYLPFNYSGYEPAKIFNSNDSKLSIFGADNRSGGGSLYVSNVGTGAEPMIWGNGTAGFGWGMQSFGGAINSDVNATTGYDGFIISVTGTMSGTVTVYGVQT